MDISAHPTRDAAMDWLYDYVSRYWEEVREAAEDYAEDYKITLPLIFEKLTKYQAVQIYFEAHPDCERHSLVEVRKDGDKFKLFGD